MNLTFIVSLGCVEGYPKEIAPALLIDKDGNEIQIPCYLFAGKREDCIKRITDDINKFYDEVEKGE